jgi:hypothetical protein
MLISEGFPNFHTPVLLRQLRPWDKPWKGSTEDVHFNQGSDRALPLDKYKLILSGML